MPSMPYWVTVLNNCNAIQANISPQYWISVTQDILAATIGSPKSWALRGIWTYGISMQWDITIHPQKYCATEFGCCQCRTGLLHWITTAIQLRQIFHNSTEFIFSTVFNAVRYLWSPIEILSSRIWIVSMLYWVTALNYNCNKIQVLHHSTEFPLHRTYMQPPFIAQSHEPF
jgi:hypothetical protein